MREWEADVFTTSLVPRLYPDRKTGRSHNRSWGKDVPAQTHVHEHKLKQLATSYGQAAASLNPRGRSAAGCSAVPWEATLHKGLPYW